MIRITRPLSVALLAIVLAAGQAEAQLSPQAYFSPKGGGAQATAEKIDAARSTIDIGMYSVSDSGPIWEALKRATARGVRVRMVLHEATSSNAAKAAALEQIGVHVFGVSKTMHQKFALIDAETWWLRKLINGSANWSRGAEERYSENTVIYNRHYGLFYAFQEQFNFLLSVATPISAGAGDHMQPVTLRAPSASTKRRERAVFTSWNTSSTTVVADEIIALMNKATRSIKIDVAHFNMRKISQALIAFHQANPQVDIQVLVDLGEYSTGVSRVKELEAAGIAVRYKTYSLTFEHPRSQLMHHKTIIVDERDMITGSYNWSRTAEQLNYENAIVVEGTGPNRSFVAAFVAEHDRLWEGGRDLYPAVLAAFTAQPGDPEYRRVLPVHFDTDYFRACMTLTRDEVAPLRSAGYRAGLHGHATASYLDREAHGVFSGTLPDDHFLGDSPALLAPAGATGLAGAVGN